MSDDIVRWILRSGSGPYTTAQIKALKAEGRIKSSDEVARSASGPWFTVQSLEEMWDTFPSTLTNESSERSKRPHNRDTKKQQQPKTSKEVEFIAKLFVFLAAVHVIALVLALMLQGLGIPFGGGDPALDKIIEAKAIVKRHANYPDTVSFSILDEPVVVGNDVTLTFTAENGFGVPSTQSAKINVKDGTVRYVD